MADKESIDYTHIDNIAIPAESMSSTAQVDKLTIDHIPTHGTVKLYDASGEIRLVPTASRDPNDPLRTPEWRKWAILGTFCLFSASGMTCANSIGAIIPNLTEYYDQVEGPKPSSQLINDLGSLPSLFIGIGAILSIFLAQGIGTRPVLVLDSIIATTGMLWSAVSNGSDRGLKSHVAARCFLSLGVGAVESLVPLMLQGLHYIHSRNSRLALIWAAGGVASSALGTASTYIIADLGWRWYIWILFILSVVALGLILVLVPETTYPRTMEDLAGISAGHDGFAEPVRSSNRKRSWRYSLRMYSSEASWATALQGIQDMFRCCMFPNITWLFLINAVFIGSTVSSSLVFGNILIGAYHWDPTNVGLLQVPLAIGSLVSVPVVGFGSDVIIRTLAKRNGGVHEPEHTLYCLTLPLAAGFVGTLCYGIFVENPQQYHWALPMVMTGLQFFGVNSVNVVSTTYAIECYPDLAEPVVIIIGALRNIIGFGLSYAVNSFVAKAGYASCFGTYAGLLGFFFVAGLPFYFKGKQLRAKINSFPFRYSKTRSGADSQKSK